MKTDEGQLDRNPERTAQASTWVVKFEALSETRWSSEEWQAWDAFAADPANLAAFDALAEEWQQAKAAPQPPWPTAAELHFDGSSAEVEQPRKLVDAESDLPAPWRSKAPTLLATAAIMAAMALGVMRLFGFPFVPPSASPPFAARYSTALGQHREITLPDGSIVVLGGGTALAVSYSDHQRTLVLDGGEAMFTVAHNAARPFRVHAAGGSITAVGTAFNVLRAAERVVVTVTEGTVEVAPREPVLQDLQVNSALLPDTARWIPMLVARGQEMRYEKGGRASAVERADIAMVTAWKHGTLVYRDRPLSEVMEDVRRYSSRQITLEAAAANLTFSGTIAEGDVDDWVRGLPRILAVEVIEPDLDGFSVRARPASAPQ